jgi:hypothetical protein
VGGCGGIYQDGEGCRINHLELVQCLTFFLALGIYFGGLRGTIMSAWATVGTQFLETVSLRWPSRQLTKA